jgi:16S rRNA processing protein RimM
MEREWVALSRLVKPHGARGEVRGVLLTDVLDNLLHREWVYWVRGNERRKLEIEAIRSHGLFLLIKFRDVEDRESAQELVGGTLEVSIDELVPLEPGEFYWYQLLGLDVYTQEGEYLGVLEEVMETAGHDVYVVRREGEEVLLPAVKEVIKQISLEQGRIVVCLLEGLR